MVAKIPKILAMFAMADNVQQLNVKSLWKLLILFSWSWMGTVYITRDTEGDPIDIFRSINDILRMFDDSVVHRTIHGEEAIWTSKRY